MAFKLDMDAEKNILLATDSDKFRKKYKETKNNIDITFASPYFYTLEKYKFYLLRKSTNIVLNHKYYYKPDYLSYDEYGTETLWYMILYLNNISSIEQFDVYDVVLPTYGAIIDIAGERVGSQVIVLGEEPKTPSSVLNLYTSKVAPNILPPGQEEGVSPVNEEPQALYWIRQKFEITQAQATNGYIDLTFVAIPSTLEVKIQNAANFIYNVDYNLIISFDSKLRRITWRPESCTEGNGLLGRILPGMILECVYAKNE